MLHGFGDGGVLATVVLVSLVAMRGDFDRRPDPSAPRRVLTRLALTVAVVPLFGIIAIWVNRATADRPFALGFALHETLIAPFSNGTGQLQAPFGEWFPTSVVILAALGIVWTLSGALAPWRYELRQAAVEQERARALVTAWGADTLAPFALRADKSYFFSVEDNAFLAYRVVGGVAIVSGDPIGAPAALEPLVGRFLAHGDGDRGRAAPHVAGGVDDRRGLGPEGDALLVLREAVLRRDRDEGDDERRAGLRRLRVHARARDVGEHRRCFVAVPAPVRDTAQVDRPLVSVERDLDSQLDLGRDPERAGAGQAHQSRDAGDHEGDRGAGARG